MGLFARLFGVSSVLFTGRRVGDATMDAQKGTMIPAEEDPAWGIPQGAHRKHEEANMHERKKKPVFIKVREARIEELTE